MKLDKKLVLPVLIIAAVGYYLYSKKKQSTQVEKPLTQAEYAGIIIASGNHGKLSDLMSFQYDYVQAWANAVQKGETKFNYQGQTYNVKGGKLAL
jgi:hypothetical protein